MFRKMGLIFVPLFALLFLAADAAKTSSKRAVDKAALVKLQDYVGSWKGVGQIRRGSTQGAWIEQSDWAWNFKGEGAALSFEAPKGKYLGAGNLYAGERAGEFRLVAKSADGKTEITYTGAIDDSEKLVLTAEKPIEGSPTRISIRLVAEGARLVVLYERQSSGESYTRMAEVGYTREGSNFGKGTAFVECVVTGGQGTIQVSHDGKTYYVCCTGCRDLFNDDPETVLAEYRERKEKEKAKLDNP